MSESPLSAVAPASGRLRVGVTPWLDPADAAGTPLLTQAERAERLGFHSLWLPEHHFGGAGSIPAPLLLLAAVAARTQRLRIGTTSYLLPLRHPLHVAAEVAVLDRLSGGRLILGAGRGFRPALFRSFEVPRREKRARLEAAIEVMQRAWRGEPVAWVEGDGAGADEPVRLAPLPLQRPHPPIWIAAFGPKGLAQAGRLGLPYLASPIESLAALEANYARHREAAERAGRALPDAVPVMRTAFTSRDPSLHRRVRDALAQQARALARGSSASLRRLAAAEVDDWAMVGEPAAVADAIGIYREKLGVTHLIVRGHVPGVEPAVLEASLAEIAALAP